MRTAPLAGNQRRSELSGAAELQAKLAQLAREIPDQVGDAMFDEMHESVELVSRQNCPEDEGDLVDSHRTVKQVDGRGISVRVEAGEDDGGAELAHAVAVHEHLSEHSPPSWLTAEAEGRPVNFRKGGPKFLERALDQAAPHILGGVAGRLRIG